MYYKISAIKAKKILKIFAFGLILSSSVNADMIRAEIGAGVWMNEPDGDISYTSGSASGNDLATIEKHYKPYAWINVKHPVPIIPNLRLEYADISRKGQASGTYKSYTASNSNSQLDITQYEIIPYYNLLDTAGITLDLGLDIKVSNFKYMVDSVTIAGSSDTRYEDSQNLILPMVYVRTRAEIPLTGVGLEIDGKYISYNDSLTYDIRLKVDYTFDFVAIQPAFELGYRVVKFKVDDSSFDEKIDVEFSGVYSGLMLRF